MTVKRVPCRPGRRPKSTVAAVLAAALLAGCGGGTSQVEVFQPSRVVVVGDDASAIVNDGSGDGFKYGINDRSSSSAGKCLSLPLYWQSLITLYGFVAEACNPNGASPKAFVQAQPGARIEDAGKGVASQLAALPSALGGADLVSVMIGVNDIVALYEDVRDGRRSTAAAVTESRRLGLALASAVNGMLATGARALVVTIPDMGLSPYALDEGMRYTGAAGLLTQLSYEFNANLRTGVDSTAYDGRNYGLVLADDVVGAMARAPTAFLASPYNVKQAACSTASLKDCTTTTLVSGATPNSHLWANDRFFGPEAHRQLGLLAQSRAANNPF